MGASSVAAIRYVIIIVVYTLSWFGLAQAQTTISGIINSDQVWDQQNSPFVIEDNLTVAAQVVLTIEPGVQVTFRGPFWMKVEGTLIAQGTAVEPVIFAGDDAATYWHRLEFLPGSSNSILEYVTITNAGNTSAGGSQAYGALYLAGSTPLLSNLIIHNNLVTGLFAENIASALTISDSEISHNINSTNAGVGAGGIFVEASSSASVILRNNQIVGNRTNSHGGGVYISGAGSVSIDGNRIAENHAWSSAGAGGGVYLANLSGDLSQNVIVDNTFIKNIADKDGGGIWIDESPLTIDNNVLHANSALDSQGGALYIGDSNIQDTVQSFSTIQNNLIYDNYSLELGGAFYIENGSHTVTHNVLYGNTADDGGGDITNEQGGALLLRDGDINFNNNVVAENAAANGGAISVLGSGNVSNNSFVSNTSRHILRLAGNLTVHGNTFAHNGAEYSILFVPKLEPTPVVNNNNFYHNFTSDGIAYLVDNLNTTLLNAQSNWWGTADENEIAWLLPTTIDYTDFTVEPLTDTPMAPPKITASSFTRDSASLTWQARSEPDVFGYKVYWGEQPAPDWEHVLDVAADTSVTISGLESDKNYYFAVTAYDDAAGNDLLQTLINEDQLSGHESWYSRPEYKPTVTAQNDSGGGNMGVKMVMVILMVLAGRIWESFHKYWRVKSC